MTRVQFSASSPHTRAIEKAIIANTRASGSLSKAWSIYNSLQEPPNVFIMTSMTSSLRHFQAPSQHFDILWKDIQTHKILHTLKPRNINAFVTGYIECNCLFQAKEVLLEGYGNIGMDQIDPHILLRIFKECSLPSQKTFDIAHTLYENHPPIFNLCTNHLKLLNSLLTFYGTHKKWSKVTHLWNSTLLSRKKDKISYTSFMKACNENSQFHTCLLTFKEAQKNKECDFLTLSLVNRASTRFSMTDLR